MTNEDEGIFLNGQGVRFCKPPDFEDKNKELYIIVLDTCACLSQGAQDSIMELKRRADIEQKRVRIIYPRLLLDELQLQKDTRVEGRTRVMKDENDRVCNAKGAFLRQSMNSSHMFIMQSDEMMEQYEKASERRSTTKDERMLRAGFQQRDISPEGKLVVLTNGILFANLCAAYGVKDVSMYTLEERLNIPQLSLNDVLFAGKTRANFKTPTWTELAEKVLLKTCLPGIRDVFTELHDGLEAVRNLRGRNLTPHEKIEARKVVSQFVTNVASVHLDHLTLEQIVFNRKKFQSEEEKLKRWDLLASELYNTYDQLENRIWCFMNITEEEVAKLLTDLNTIGNRVCERIREIDATIQEDPHRSRLTIDTLGGCLYKAKLKRLVERKN